jgi:threonine dehydrogenase-like Zn-dependent dehydrogenase
MTVQEPELSVVRITLGSICSSDLHILHGCVPKTVLGITVVTRWSE